MKVTIPQKSLILFKYFYSQDLSAVKKSVKPYQNAKMKYRNSLCKLSAIIQHIVSE